MKRFLQGLIATFAFVCMFALFGQVASAEETSSLIEKEAPAIVEVPPVEYYNPEVSPFAMNFLKMWGSNATKNGSNKIDFEVETETYGIRDRVGAKVYIEYYSNGKWIEGHYAGDRYDTNVSEATIYGTATVSTGYYYRIKSLNYAVHNGVREEAYSYSSSIYMN